MQHVGEDRGQEDGWLGSAFSWLLPSSSTSTPSRWFGRDAAVLYPLTQNGGLQALLYEEDRQAWNIYVQNSQRTGKSTLSDGYRAYLRSAAAAVRAHATHTDGVPLLVTLGPPWEDRDMYREWQASTWEESDVRWEIPAGLGLLPLDELAAACSRLHEHMGMPEGPSEKKDNIAHPRFAVLHARTCSGTSARVVTFMAACHLVYSCGFDSVNDALAALNCIPPERGTPRLLPGQRRYCEYLNCVLHHPELLPEGGEAPLVLTEVLFCKLSSFAPITGGHSERSKRPPGPLALPILGAAVRAGGGGASTPSTPRAGLSPSSSMNDVQLLTSPSGHLNPGRLLLSIYCRGVEVWAGGVAPGSIDEDADMVAFDLRRRGSEGLNLLGDIVLAVWFEDHKSVYDRPVLAYAFHTAFVDHGDISNSGGNGSTSRIRVPARHLDVENPSYSELADKEGFFMEVTLRQGVAAGPISGPTAAAHSNPGGPIAPSVRGFHAPSLRADWVDVMARLGQLRCDQDEASVEASTRALMRQLRRRDPGAFDITRRQLQLPPLPSPVSTVGTTDASGRFRRPPLATSSATAEVELTPLGSSRSSEADASPITARSEAEVAGTPASDGSKVAQFVDASIAMSTRMHVARQPDLIDDAASRHPDGEETMSISTIERSLEPNFEQHTIMTAQHESEDGQGLALPSIALPASVGKSAPPPAPPLPGKVVSPASAGKLAPPPAPPLPSKTASPASAGKSAPPPAPPLPGKVVSPASSGKSAPPSAPPLPGKAISPASGGKLAPPPAPPLPGKTASPASSGKSAPPSAPPLPGKAISPASAGKAPAPPPPPPPGSKASPISGGKAPPPPPPPPGGKTPPFKPPGAPTSRQPASPLTTPGSKLRHIYWSKVPRAHGTVWDDLAPVDPLGEPFLSALISLFKDQAPSFKVSTPSKGRAAGPVVKLIPLPRANNISVMLSKFKSFGGGGGTGIRDALLSGSDIFSLDQLERLAQLAPTSEEADALARYRGDPSELSPPEQFLLKMTKIPRLSIKIETLIFRCQFHKKCDETRGGLETLKTACAQLRNSRRFKRVLATVLATGNVLNAGTVRGNAQAIKLSLLKLGEVKVTAAPQSTGGIDGRTEWNAQGKTDKPHNGQGEEERAPAGSVMTPGLRSLMEFVAWTVLKDSLYKAELTADQATQLAQSGFLADELSSLRVAVRRMEGDVLDALKYLDAGMKTVRKEIEAEKAMLLKKRMELSEAARGDPEIANGNGVSNGLQESEHKDAHAPSPFLQALEVFMTEAEDEQRGLNAAGEDGQRLVAATITWLGESPDSDALGVFKAVQTFVTDFDMAFARAHRMMATSG